MTPLVIGLLVGGVGGCFLTVAVPAVYKFFSETKAKL
jgi:hypothetical protein